MTLQRFHSNRTCGWQPRQSLRIQHSLQENGKYFYRSSDSRIEMLPYEFGSRRVVVTAVTIGLLPRKRFTNRRCQPVVAATARKRAGPTSLFNASAGISSARLVYSLRESGSYTICLTLCAARSVRGIRADEFSSSRPAIVSAYGGSLSS